MIIDSNLEQRLRELMTEFLKMNANINLSALRTENACWYGNILDSLAFLDLIEKNIIPTPKNILDVGTGGGFPLLPLALALPNVQCTGLDATGKKIDAIKRIAKAINLTSLKLIADRTEAAGRNREHREMYEVVTARAVAPLNALLEYTVPFTAVNGYVVLWKSMHIDEELRASANAQKLLHCRLIESYKYTIGGDWGERQLLVFKKTAATQVIYPRAVGMAKKEPL